MVLILAGNEPAKSIYDLFWFSPDTRKALNVGDCLSKQLFIRLQETRTLQRVGHLSSRAPGSVVCVDGQSRLVVQPSSSAAFLLCFSIVICFDNSLKYIALHVWNIFWVLMAVLHISYLKICSIYTFFPNNMIHTESYILYLIHHQTIKCIHKNFICMMVR